MKKLIYAAGLALSLSLAGISSSAFASEVEDSSSNKVLVEQNALFEKANENLLELKNSAKRSLGTDHPTPYSQITTYSDGSATGVDFSEATFYDEAGNEIEPPMDNDTDLITPLSDGTSGGTWSSGSGYTCVKGVKVLGWYSYPSIEMSFKADFCMNSGTYDEISRVYSPYMNVFDWEQPLNQGVFRAKETSEYSAYGGISAKVRRYENSNATLEHVYLRVQNDTYWVDSSFD
ncbi:hypothetical protein AB1J28_05865 [Lysinibacillus irui]|uniref:hypothetical protein n=1 Tax=Lysinibacillus irui TaxID=2998077 RepID=UPI003D2CDB7F